MKWTKFGWTKIKILTMTRKEEILAWLNRYRDHDVIKIITGVRGCGKSTLLSAYGESLPSQGVQPENIIQLNLESPDCRHLRTPEALLDLVDSKAHAHGRVYLLLDEIHELPEFDAALGGLFALKRFDIVATCSNKRPVSENFRQYLSGKFAHLEMTPPPFREIPARPGASTFAQRLRDHLLHGALPYAQALRDSPRDADIYLNGLWNTILVKDLLSRNRVSDSLLVERLLERIYDHLGEVESLRKIGADATIDGREAAPNTIETYLLAIDESMLARRVFRYDLYQGETSKSGYRFFLADLALGRCRYGKFPGNPDNAIRNLIYLELCTRGGKVMCGRYDGSDFDFVVLDETNHAHCWQYAPKLVNGKVPTPILAPLKRLPPDVPKTIITAGELPKRTIRDFNYVTLEQFLLEKEDWQPSN